MSDGWLIAAANVAEPTLARIVAGALLIFGLRVIDVSIDTIRIMASVRGRRWTATLLGFVESSVFIIALAQVIRPPMHPLQMLGYAAGFAVGTLVGTTIGRRTSSRYLLMRVLSREHGEAICEKLRAGGFAVTVIPGEGMEGPVPLLFTLLKRSRADEALALVKSESEQAFVVFESIEQAVGGFAPNPAPGGFLVRR
jgi:uncharacterized protein YebE (UPF0316 family)